MHLPGPTVSVGIRIDYSVGPWDYSDYATRHLKDRLLGGPLGLLRLCHTAPEGVGRKDYGEVLV
jgi:hypothetical protein